MTYILVNPEQYYNFSITKYKFFYTKQYSVHQYKYLKEKPATLIFGTSQTHMLSSKMLKRNALNFHNLYGEPGDILNFLKQLDHKQIENTHEIIYLIDLRAGAIRKDYNFINYQDPSKFPKINLKSLINTYKDLEQNYFLPLRSYLNHDGSVEYVNNNEHIGNIKPYNKNANLKFNIDLLNSIIEIDKFCKKNNIKITYITPVTNVEYFKTIDFNLLAPFYSHLFNNGIEEIKLFYYVEGISNLKNENSEYVAFIEKDHLNPKFFEKWLFEYILTDTSLDIKDHQSLRDYIQRMQEIQSIYLKLNQDI